MGIINKENALAMVTGMDNSGLRTDAQEAKDLISDVGDQAQKTGSSMKNSFMSMESTILSVRSTMIALDKTMSDLNAKMSSGSATQAETTRIKELEDALSDLRQKYDKLSSSIPKTNDEFKNSSSTVRQITNDYNALSASLNRAMTALGIGFSVIGLKNFASEVINVRGEMQMLESSFEVLLKGKNVSGFMTELKQFAIESHLSLEGVAKSAQTLLGFGVAADSVMPTIKELGDVSMGNKERFRALSLAFAQTTSAGKLMGQDLLQYVNAGFNPLQIISEKTGKSIGELRKEVEAGAISADMVADAFKSATAEGGQFYGMTQKQAEGIKGLQAQLEGALQTAFNNIGQSQNDVIAGGYKLATSLVENYETVGKVLGVLVATYGFYKASLIALSAVENIRATAAVYDIATKEIQIGLTLKNAAAQTALNRAIMANPYVAAAAALVGLVGIMWALHDSTTAAEKAQADYNKEKEEAVKAAQKEKAELEKNIATLNDEASSRLDIVRAMGFIQKQYPALFKKYVDEKGHIKDLIGLWHDYNEARGIESVKNNKTALEAAKKKVKDLEEEFRIAAENGDVSSVSKKLADARAYVGERQKAVEKDNIDSLMASITGMGNKTLEAQIAVRRKLLADLRNMKPGSVGKIEGLGTFSKQEISEQLKALEAESENRNNKSTYGSVYEKAKKAWEDSKKTLQAIEKDKDKYSKEQYEDAKSREEANKKAFKDLGGDTKDTSKSDAKKAIKAQEELNQEKVQADARKKQIEESREKLKKSVKQTEIELTQAVIDGEKDGFEKQKKQIDLNHEKRKLDIEKRASELIKEQQSIEEKQWENANPNYKKQGKTFIPTTTSEAGLSTDAKAELKNLRDKDNQETLNANKKLLDDILDQAQDYQTKREKIETDINDKIKALEALRNPANSEAIDKAIAELKKKLARDLSSLDFENFKLNINWEQVFGDLNNISTDGLKKLKGELQGVMNAGKDKMTPENLKAVSEAIKKIDDITNNRSPFEAIKSGLEGYRISAAKVTAIQKYLNQLTDEGKKGSQSYKKAEEDLSKAQTERQKSLKQISQGINKVGQTGKEAVSAAQDIFDTLELVGVKVNGTLKGYMEGMGTMMDGLSSIDLTKPMTIITGGVKVMKGAVQQITSVLDGGHNGTKNFEEMKTTLGSYIEVLQKVIDKQKERLSDMSGATAQAAYEEAKSALLTQIQQYRELAKAAGEAGAGLFSHSKGYNTNKALSGYWEALSKSAGITIDSIDDLYSLSAEQLQKIQTDNQYAWSLIDSDIKTYLQNIIDAQDQLDSLSDSINEALTGISFDSVKSGLDDLLKDTSTTMSDISNNFEEMMRNSILKFVKDQYLTKALKDWYAKYAEYAGSDNELTDAEVQDLQTLYENIYSKAQSQYDALAKAAGISASSSSQSSTYGSSTSMNQDTGDLIVGRSTAILESGVRREGQNDEIIAILKLANSNATDIKGYELEIAENVLMIRQDISDMSINMTKLVVNTNKLHDIDDKLEKIRKNTENI